MVPVLGELITHPFPHAQRIVSTETFENKNNIFYIYISFSNLFVYILQGYTLQNAKFLEEKDRKQTETQVRLSLCFYLLLSRLLVHLKYEARSVLWAMILVSGQVTKF